MKYHNNGVPSLQALFGIPKSMLEFTQVEFFGYPTTATYMIFREFESLQNSVD